MVLVTHAPTSGGLDRTARGNYVGCRWVADAVVAALRPLVHVFGHNHDTPGAVVGTCSVAADGVQESSFDTLFVNAAATPGISDKVQCFDIRY